ncbi:MAG: diguanylate cyclase [Defluviitaleaceae bacterium]|nr:diguanylate cyclase [Defluviitaleaceae bacterium]MCL2274246.1 diguanylate cyclase [Defluviitaleaceae bacterium]
MHKRITTLLRILFIIIPTVVIIVIMGVGLAISRSISEDTAQRLSRQYAIEAASNFLSSTSPHLSLMQQFSRSSAIAHWMANENDAYLRARAFDDIAGYARHVPDVYIMFTVYDSLQAYNFDAAGTVETFSPWGRIGPRGNAESQWFYNTLDSEAPFILNVQSERRVDDYFEMYVWSNHRIYYAQRLVGVVTIGSAFDTVFYATFANFDVDGRRGYIIDENGRVRIDSDLLLPVNEAGLPLLPVMPEAEKNPALAARIYEHAQQLQGGIYPIGTQPLAPIRLTYGGFFYASIAPIVGTGWSVVVLSDDVGSIIGGRYFPLIIIAICIMFFTVTVGLFLINKIALVPMAHEINENAHKEHEATSRLLQIYNASPIPSSLWNLDFTPIECNQAMVDLLGISDKSVFIEKFNEICPEVQADGVLTREKRAWVMNETMRDGICHYKWEYISATGQRIPGECVAKRVDLADSQFLSVHFQDMRKIYAMMAAEAEVKRMLRTVNKAAAILLNINFDSGGMDAYNEGIALLGTSLDADRVQIWQQSEENGEPIFILQYNWLSEYAKKLRNPEVGYVLKHELNPAFFSAMVQGRVVNSPVSALPADVTDILTMASDMVSIVIIPLSLNGENIGFFSVQECRKPRIFTPDEVDIITSAGFMFTNVLNQQLQATMAQTDVLTGARNRRYLIAAAERDLAISIENDTPFSLIIADIDWFKTINDKYGHGVGDETLKIFTARVSNAIKEGTLLARYGGEEFVVILPNTTLEDAVKTAERLRKTVADAPFRIGTESLDVSASFGVACKTPLYMDLTKILKQADLALYRAKDMGRNAVVSAEAVSK